MRYGRDTQLAIFHVPERGYYATQQMCPHKRAFILDHGIVGDDKDGNLYVSCPCVSSTLRRHSSWVGFTSGTSDWTMAIA